MALPVLRRNRVESAPVAWRAPLGQPWSDFGELYERMRGFCLSVACQRQSEPLVDGIG
jgi:hypothetical protein